MLKQQMSFENMKIHQFPKTQYLGSKQKLAEWIYHCLSSEQSPFWMPLVHLSCLKINKEFWFWYGFCLSILI